MLPGLSVLELGRLRMSVGYGTHKKGRPLSPIEVGTLLRQARSEGVSLEDCARAINLEGTGHIGRFLKILDLPQDLQHLVDWGAGDDFIGFSSAVELARFGNPDDQHAVAHSILSDGLNSKEVRQVAQLRTRSGRPICACVTEVLGMRTRIERRYVFLGSIGDPDVTVALSGLTQVQRDLILESAIDHLALHGTTGRLGKTFFTLVGDERFDASMRTLGKKDVEARLRTHISEALDNDRPQR